MLTPQELLTKLSKRGVNIGNIEFTRVGVGYFANIYQTKRSEIITSSVYTGYASSPQLALKKSVSEMIERMSFEEGASAGELSCDTTNSDGFAVLPADFLPNRKDVLSAVRNIALAEGIERFSWATWWDKKTKSSIVEYLDFKFLRSQFNELADGIFAEIYKIIPIEAVYVIKPEVKFLSSTLVIFFIKIQNGGYLSGGACGEVFDDTFVRALAELYRHAKAWERIEKFKLMPVTFYEKRLNYFASGSGNAIVGNVLSESDKSEVLITLPNLKVDVEVPHKFSDLFVSYRCLFEDQPPFVGGELERLCL